MATSLTAPAAIGQPFANNGDKATLPESTSAKIASLSAGFPLATSLPIASGGAYPRRSDMNALGFLATSFQFFMQNGGVMAYNADVSTAIGGYPAGARLWTTIDGVPAIVRSLVNNNGLAPETNTDGVNWIIEMSNGNFNVIQYNYEANSGTDGISVLATTWTKVPVATAVSTTLPAASIASSVFSLPAGTYEVDFSAVFVFGNVRGRAKTRIRATGTNTTLAIGSSGYAPNFEGAEPTSCVSSGVRRFTLSSASTTVEFQVWGNYAFTLGYKATSGEKEDYGYVRFKKIG